MAKEYKTPGVYVEEKNTFGSSIVSNETAIPVFIGFTEFSKKNDGKELGIIEGSKIVREPALIQSMLEYETTFGGADLSGNINLTSEEEDGKINYTATNQKGGKPYTPSFVHPSVSNYFSNGGGSCYIISLGSYDDFNAFRLPKTISNEMEKIEEAIGIAEKGTLILPTDLIRFGYQDYYSWGTQFVNFAAKEKRYFTILDAIQNDPNSSEFDRNDIDHYRSLVTPDFPSYIASYYPYLKSLTPYAYQSDLSDVYLDGDPVSSASSETKESVKTFLATNYINMPPSPFIAGIYSRRDNTVGVWTPPVNTAPTGVLGPLVAITDKEQGELNISVTGKSINAIRHFTGKGTLVWGARTNAGNNLDWRYINVRRLANSMEMDISQALEAYIFKPNVHNTWVEIKTMIESYLFGLYSDGAFVGTSPSMSYNVLIGLGETMTDEDVLNGYVNVSVMFSPVRPAEFVVLKFSQLIGQ